MNASDVINKITRRKRGQVPFVRYVSGKDELLAQKLRWCGSLLQFREWLNHGESRLINANFCKKHLLCPWCAHRRGLKSLGKYLVKAESIMQEMPELHPLMVTLTNRNGQDLVERVGHYKESMKNMNAAARKAKSNPAKNLPLEWNKLAGALTAVEVTNKNQGKGWHVHSHTFALATEWIDREKLSQELERFTGDSFIVDVRLCKNGIIRGLCEVLKYALKPGSLTNEQTWQAHLALAGKRLLNPAGLFRGVLVGDIDQDELPDLDGPTRDFLALWMFGEQKYTLRDLQPEEFMTRQQEAEFACQIAFGQKRS